MNTPKPSGPRRASIARRAVLSLLLLSGLVAAGVAAPALAGTWSNTTRGVAAVTAAAGEKSDPPPPNAGSVAVPNALPPAGSVAVPSALPPAASPSVPSALAPGLAGLSNELADLSERGMESVVSIAVARTVPTRSYGFGPSGESVQRGQGSGVVVSEDGYILTNNHVVDSATEVMVTTSNGEQLAASVVGTDPATDLAVVRLDAPPSGLRPLAFGDSDAVRPGQLALAIGNPFGLAGSVSLGIVSATGRDQMGITDYEDFIQTDTAINPGNSGGALIDMHGRLIGINTAIFSRSGGSQGIGFAVPANMAQRVMDALVTDGAVARGWLGVGIAELPVKVANAQGVDGGVVVSSVDPRGPAGRAGLREGDIVLSIDGTPMDDVDRLRFRVADLGPGHPAQLRILRADGESTLVVPLGERPAPQALSGRLLR